MNEQQGLLTYYYVQKNYHLGGMMLVRLEPREWLVVGHGVLAMFACIVAGSIIVEIQLNQLTYWLDFVQVFNIRPAAEGAYLAYALGGEYYVKAAWQIGTIANTSRSLQVSLLGVGISLPTKADFDASIILPLLQAAWRQGIEYAFAGKRYAADCWSDYAPLVQSIWRQVGDLLR